MSNGQRSSDSFFESNFSDHTTTTTMTPPESKHDTTTATDDSSDTPQAAIPELDEATLNNSVFTLRALVTTKEAGVIIGKSGKNVADMRDDTGVRAGVSKPVPGQQERVLTVSGTLAGVAGAYGMAAQTLIDSPPLGNYAHALSPPAPPGIATVRLLISHQQMGSVIGRQGATIKAVQENCKVRMVASKEMLPNSTERVVEIQGTANAVRTAIWEIGKCLLEDWDRAAGTVPYNPQPRQPAHSNHHNQHHRSRRPSGEGEGDDEDEDSHSGDQVETMSVASDMVGCIIGKGGAKIQEIRRQSGAQISIAKQAHDNSGERLFTIRGKPEANQDAIQLLKQEIENEEARREEAGSGSESD